MLRSVGWSTREYNFQHALFGQGKDACSNVLRVQVQGHGNPILQTGKINVGINKVEHAGQYALKITFDDGHDSGLFTWEYLHELGRRQTELWDDYLAELKKAGKSRDPSESIVKLML